MALLMAFREWLESRGVPTWCWYKLTRAGYLAPESIALATDGELASIRGFGPVGCEIIRAVIPHDPTAQGGFDRPTPRCRKASVA